MDKIICPQCRTNEVTPMKNGKIRKRKKFCSYFCQRDNIKDKRDTARKELFVKLDSIIGILPWVTKSAAFELEKTVSEIKKQLTILGISKNGGRRYI